jgi:hypothetical protein
MKASLLQNENVDYLDELLLDGDFLKLLPASEYRKINHEHLRLWAHHNSRYGFPTVELIEWLDGQIDGNFAIELASGKGDLGRHLNIIQTDSYIQTTPQVKALYIMMGQPIVEPPESVLEYDALVAVKGIKPDVAIASWLTQLVEENECTPETQGSVYGGDEIQIIANVKKYIHIGNEDVHSTKKALALPHQELKFPWLVSRGEDQSKNVIYIWEK